jgi:Tat protein translocase TatB subunit
MNIFNLGPLELIIIGVVALLVVGPRQLPELGRMVGRWMKTFREASDEMKRSLYMEDDFRRQPPPKPRPSLKHTQARGEDPADISDRGANQGKYDAEDLDPDQSRVETEQEFAPDPAAVKTENEPSEEAKRSYENIDYDREGAD